MPYIKPEQRRTLDGADGDEYVVPEDVGELTYVLTTWLLKVPADFRRYFDSEITDYLESDRVGEPRFQDYAEVLGALTAIEYEYERRRGGSTDAFFGVQMRVVLKDLDFYRRRWYHEHVAPYEDRKIEENGDVYPRIEDERSE